VKKKI